MDTIIRENPHTICIEHAVLPPAAPQLTAYQRLVTRTLLTIESVFERVICCVPNNIVEDWEFDVVVRQTVAAVQYDDVEFSEIAEYFNEATLAEEVNEQFIAQAALGELLANPNGVVSCGPVTAVNDIHAKFLPTDEESLVVGAGIFQRTVRIKRGVRAQRRRRRVVAYVVVALINKVRCKYYHMDDSAANRRLVGSYLLKLMREHNFRTSDIHQHVSYAVDLYFALSGKNVKTTVYARG